jgi:hypothetical protein
MRPLVQVTVEGLEIMNDDPSEVDVLYAKVIHQVLFKCFPFFLSDFAPSVFDHCFLIEP